MHLSGLKEEFAVDKQSSSESCSTCSLSSSSSSSEEILHATKLDVVLTKKGLRIYGTWSKEKLLKLLTDRLEKCVDFRSDELKKISDNVTNEKRLWIAIHSGLYSVRLLRQLKEKGMSIHGIIKAMKLGLINLSHCEMLHFKDFKVQPYILEFEEMWSKELSDELIINLSVTGLNEMECWNIIVHGVAVQNAYILRHLTLSGIDVFGILNWQSPINVASPKIVEFLRHIGIRDDTVQLIERHGIDEETEQMLVDLGLNDMEDKLSNMEEIICECSLTILEPCSNSVELIRSICKTDSSKTSSSLTDTPDYLQQCACQCHILAKNKTAEEIKALRTDYLRQNIMVPLTWAMARTLKYNPSDPTHFIAYQLTRWVQGAVPQIKKDNLQQFIALSTIAMDKKLIARKELEEMEQLKKMNEKAIENMPCDICKDHQELHRIKKQCWKCIKRPIRKFESCEFPETCSSCKINVSNKSDDLHL